MSLRRFFGRALFFALLAISLAGCDSGPKVYSVEGSVQFKGQNIKFGTISFRATDGASGAAQIVDGKYLIPKAGGMTAGEYKVAISYPDPKIPAPNGSELPGQVLPSREMLPKKYNDNTELTAVVKAQEKNEISFDLK